LTKNGIPLIPDNNEMLFDNSEQPDSNAAVDGITMSEKQYKESLSTTGWLDDSAILYEIRYLLDILWPLVLTLKEDPTGRR
jgi:hypothetical protein